MWFKNLTIYRLVKNYALTAEALETFVRKQAFAPCGDGDMSSQGFVSPRENDQLVHTVNGQFLLRFATAKKLLPSSVVNQATKARAAEIEEQQGFAPGRKAMKDLKERVTDELLPRAFTVLTSTNVWIDPINGWLVIDTSSSTKADDVIKYLLKSVEKFPVQLFRTKTSPQTAMTDWLANDEAPKGFTIDQDVDLTSHTEEKAKVRFMHHTIDVEDVQRHIAAGKSCTSLAMTWNDRISFVFDATFTIKKVRPIDILQEKDSQAENQDDRFDADFLLMTSELSQMLDDIAFALGGESDEQSDLVQEDAKVAA